MTTTFELESDELFHQSISNFKTYIECAFLKKKADCVARSMETYIKLLNIQPVRVRGQRPIDKSEGCSAYHYWVEARGLVYDIHGGVTQIMSIDKYYERNCITNKQNAEWGMLFDSEMDFVNVEVKENAKNTTNRTILNNWYKLLEKKMNDQ